MRHAVNGYRQEWATICHRRRTKRDIDVIAVSEEVRVAIEREVKASMSSYDDVDGFFVVRVEDIDIQTVSKLAHFASPQGFIDNLAAGAQSTRQVLAQVSDRTRQTIIEDVSASLAPYVTPDGLAYPNACHILTARS